MSNNPQRFEVSDRFTPERKAIFERPREDNDTIVITIPPGSDFHLDAGTLRVIADVLTASPSTKEIL